MLGRMVETARLTAEFHMEQLVKIKWHHIDAFTMPPVAGTYLVAWDDHTVESYPVCDKEIKAGKIRSGSATAQFWADSLLHPNVLT
jgi:hypothetical protein